MEDNVTLNVILVTPEGQTIQTQCRNMGEVFRTVQNSLTPVFSVHIHAIKIKETVEQFDYQEGVENEE